MPRMRLLPVVVTGSLISIGCIGSCESNTQTHPSEPVRDPEPLVVRANEGELRLNSAGDSVPDSFPFAVLPGTRITTSYSRLERGKVSSQMARFDFDGRVDQALTFYRLELEKGAYRVEEREGEEDGYPVSILEGEASDGSTAQVAAMRRKDGTAGLVVRISWTVPAAPAPH